MKELDQKIAFAKALGWTEIETHHFDYGEPLCCGIPKTRESQVYKRTFECLPNVDDLNVVTRAWGTLTYNQQATFGHHLSVIVFGKGLADGMLFGEHDLSRLSNATAAQKLEAFLKTLDLWED